MASNIPLLMGIGATKCGTSWLYDYLRGHPECGLRAVKELRYFTAVDWDKRKVQADIIAERMGGLADKIAKAGDDVPAWMRSNMRDLQAWHPVIAEGDVAAYLDYVFDVRPGAKVAGDISPEYSRLSGDRIAQMAEMAPDTRWLYIVREPLARFWSHVRMTAGDRARWYKTDDAADRAPRIARRALAEAGDLEVVESGAYAKNLIKLAALPREKVKVIFYEELFTDFALRDLCAWLGMSFKPGNYGREVFKGADMSWPDGLESEAYAYLAPEYTAVEEFVGRLPQNWQDTRAALA